jgi:hypothetical protein
MPIDGLTASFALDLDAARDRGEQLLARRDRRLLVLHVAQHHEELVAAVARDHVDVRRTAGMRRRHLRGVAGACRASRSPP